MGYHLHKDSKNTGPFPLEELKTRRETGELTGAELVWTKGMQTWAPLDQVLKTGPNLGGPPPLTKKPGAKDDSRLRAWIGGSAIAITLIILITGGVFVAKIFSAVKQRKERLQRVQKAEGLPEASRPVLTNSNTKTVLDSKPRSDAFKRRIWLEEFKTAGDPSAPYYTEGLSIVERWLDESGKTDQTVATWLDRQVRNPGFNDPLLLTIAGITSSELHEKNLRLQRALQLFPSTKYRSYVQFRAAVALSYSTESKPDEQRAGRIALNAFANCFKDGSIGPENQQDLAEVIINGWANGFFESYGHAMAGIPQDAGKEFEWLGLVLEAELKINDAWAARGGGYSNTVTQKGWQLFAKHLAEARKHLTRAWELHPDYPLAPAKMITIAMGESDVSEMRLWFDRATQAQLDYEMAWSNMAWGFRPRWFGSPEAILAFGKSALESRRFDTKVPFRFSKAVAELESELDTPFGQHMFGRHDIWPLLETMYRGYINEPGQRQLLEEWRSGFAVTAYLAGRHSVAREQLEAMNWSPVTAKLSGWKRDLTLMPLEVAARTGSAATRVDEAENLFAKRSLAEAMVLYKEIEAMTAADSRTLAFARHRIAMIQMEQSMTPGKWVEFGPASLDDPAWHTSLGVIKMATPGSFDVYSDKGGHMVTCRARTGTRFEIQGEFEVIQSNDGQFQAGIVMGLPDFGTHDWRSVRIKRNKNEGEVASFADGWSKSPQTVTARVSEKTTFHIRYDGNVTVTVNGKDVLQNASLERPMEHSPTDFAVGFGAFNDMNETVIRYKSVKFRKL